METIMEFFNAVIHLDSSLNTLISQYGIMIYVLLFLCIFSEVGLVVTGFLPGDSLLFVAGALAATGSLDIVLLVFLFWAAAFLGNMSSYGIGSLIGPKLFHKEDAKILKKENYEKTHEFFEKYGGITIIVSRFMPLLRTFAPLVGGMGKMPLGRMLLYSAIGCLLWTGVYTLVGFFLGNVPFIRENFAFIIVCLVIVTLIPAIVTFIRKVFFEKKTVN